MAAAWEVDRARRFDPQRGHFAVPESGNGRFPVRTGKTERKRNRRRPAE
jgi:hypothetical protein